MKYDEHQQKWAMLLSSWKSDVFDIRARNKDSWQELGLPNVNDVAFSEVDVVGIRLFNATWPRIDPEVLAFYGTPNGWPLWLGSFGCVIRKIGDAGPFKVCYPDAFAIARESAPIVRADDFGLAVISKSDLDSAFVLSGPDAREFVLSLPTGETCLYHFDGMKLFDNFFEFMQYRRGEVAKWLDEMLPG